MIRLSTYCACIFLMMASSALAFDCSSSVPLVCNGPAESGTIGLPPEVTFSDCGGATSFKHKLYTLTVASAQSITVSVTGVAASVVEVVVFNGCDENACVASSPPNSSVLPPTCLVPGTYTIALKYLVEAVMDYEISVDCVDCVPVVVEERTLGTIKAQYR